MDRNRFRRRQRAGGADYSLEQFARRYELEDEQAEDLFYRFGPSSVELDLLMAANRGGGRNSRLWASEFST